MSSVCKQTMENTVYSDAQYIGLCEIVRKNTCPGGMEVKGLKRFVRLCLQ